MIGRRIVAGALVVVAMLALVVSDGHPAMWFGAVVLLSLAGFTMQQGWLVHREPEAEKPVNPFAEPQPSPLLKEAMVSLWDGVVVGYLQSGLPLLFRGQDTSILIAGEPRAGKTVFLNNIISAAALDPRAQFALFDGKGSNEFMRWEGLAERIDRSGDAGPLLSYLTTLHKEMRRRYDVLRNMDCVKLTRDIYQTDMPLYLLVIDELAAYTSTFPNKKLGQSVAQMLAKIAAQGPAVGVILVLATQRTSVDVVPAIVRDNIGMRVAFRVPNPLSSDVILGRGMAKQGYDASTIKRITERGIGYADIDGGWPKKFRSCLLEYSDTKPIADRAHAVRAGIPLGRLPDAVTDPEDVAVPSRSLADDIRYIWRGADRLHNVELLRRLQALDHRYYGEWSQQLLGRRLRDVGLAKFKKQWTEGDRVNAWGLPASALEEILEADDGTTPAERRRERESMAMDALDEIGKLAYEARIAEIAQATECTYCPAQLGPDNPPTVDHFWPLADGGTNEARNLVPACGSCNSSKKDRNPFEFMKTRRTAA